MGCKFRFLLLYILQYDSVAYQPYQNNLAAALYLISISFQYINSVHYSTQCRSESLHFLQYSLCYNQPTIFSCSGYSFIFKAQLQIERKKNAAVIAHFPSSGNKKQHIYSSHNISMSIHYSSA